MAIKIPVKREWCGAKTRSGEPCRNRPMPNGRCRMHGGKSTGPRPENRWRCGIRHGANVRRVLNRGEQKYMDDMKRQFRSEHPDLSQEAEKLLHELCLCMVRMNRLLSYKKLSYRSFYLLTLELRKSKRVFEAAARGECPGARTRGRVVKTPDELAAEFFRAAKDKK